MTVKIKYRKLKHYKYQLLEDWFFFTGCPVLKEYKSCFVDVSDHGFVAVRKGYAWDGPSGPTIDTENFMRGSLMHDVMYQLLREEVIHMSYRDHADLMLRQACVQDGMSRLRANYIYYAVKWFGKKAAMPKTLL